MDEERTGAQERARIEGERPRSGSLKVPRVCASVHVRVWVCVYRTP